MSVERELSISILKLTRRGPVEHELINRDAKIPSVVARNLRRRMQKQGLIYLRDHDVETDSLQRLKLAVHAIELGADPERVATFLQWAEFEHMTATIFEKSGYTVTKNLRFKEGNKRWEIDIVACRKPIAICTDCKHWHRTMFPSAMKRIAEEQAQRTKGLAESLPSPDIHVQCATWENGTLIPAVLSLFTGRFKFCNDVPVVSVLQIQDFLTQLPAFVTMFRGYEIGINHIA
jgi:Holliday junction resolvase-like predicted endonuclease